MKKLIISDTLMSQIKEYPLLSYGIIPDKNDNKSDTFNRAAALFLLVLHENQTGNGKYVSRIIEHLESAAAPEGAPNFDAICLWSYCPFSASIALARATPVIWEKCSPDLRKRLDFIMKMYAYLESFATSDDNCYNTGPGLTGNYCKDWNPNYRLANVPAIIFAVHFFGTGNMKKGADAVNTLLHGFHDEEYERTIAQLEKFGWSRAKAVWTAPAWTHEDGSRGTDARTVLIHGGTTYSLDYTYSYVTKDAGNGLGISNGGKNYRYHGTALDRSDAIIEDLLAFNYSGGQVKSEHHYDVDEDGIAEKVAWILDGSLSPYQGQTGMMKEFASGDRSSAGYCAHDFKLTTILISAAKALDIYDVSSNTALWNMIKVGNGDFLYKNKIGYQGFATGSYGTNRKCHSEKDEGPIYFALKNLWSEAISQLKE